MMNLKTLAVATLIVGAAVLPISALAQGRGQGGGQQQGGGRGMGGMMQMQQSKANLVARADVRLDIKTTADQNTKLDALQKDFRDKLTAQRGQGGGGQQGAGGQRPDMEAIRKQMEEMNKTYEESVMKVLDAGQQKRLGEIELQMKGNQALLDAKLQKELGFSVDQKRKIDDLQASMSAANTAVFERARNGEIEMTEVQTLREENNKILEAELSKILTADQTKAFETMKGAKFTRDPKVDEAMRGNRRGGGGGGN